jgi:hypothetical protein
VRTCESETLPMLVGGDFNIIRKREEKHGCLGLDYKGWEVC